MNDQQRGYAAYWKRVSIKLGLSDAAKRLGGDIRGSHLSSFEQGKEHPLTGEQIEAYIALLDQLIAERPPITEEMVEEDAGTS
ncbi:MAG: hypothetical protein AB7G88_01545 [Thermomicrobiales bacterium]